MRPAKSMLKGGNRMMPKDPNMLLSFVNTQLRDKCASLADLAAEYGTDAEQIIRILAGIGYVYDENLNRFIKK